MHVIIRLSFPWLHSCRSSLSFSYCRHKIRVSTRAIQTKIWNREKIIRKLNLTMLIERLSTHYLQPILNSLALKYIQLETISNSIPFESVFKQIHWYITRCAWFHVYKCNNLVSTSSSFHSSNEKVKLHWQ